LSKALVAGAYQRKLEEIARLGVELTALVPPSWREPRVGEQRLERRFTEGYRLESLPIALNGRHHLHFYPALGRALRHLRPDVLHIDEESFNLATFLAMRAGMAVGARCCFYNWANIDRRYPPPFSLFERHSFRHAAHAIAGNQEAAAIIRRHGYRGPVTVIPQFGVDPEMFAPRPDIQHSTFNIQHFTVGYLGRLVPEKGVLDLVEALPGLPGHIRLRLIGDGAQRPQIMARAAALGVAGRVELRPAVGSTEVPAAMAEIDLLVLPSRTTASWKEQFGRVLIEAMSCGVPVLGSSSGEIPHVIGDAGLTFPEGDVAALRYDIAHIADDASLRADLIERGRARILAEFTQAAVARRHVAVYAAMLGQTRID
ncbi:glycosyltransferase family 4 protein, partial [Oscillochloris sp. ZM17-4]|uniref:glycosyltransferase family 4 protein n=1 Tax=Oscillochloris sp. ZM17-4 TaxID=2866714 RepID=UPI001C72BC3E